MKQPKKIEAELNDITIELIECKIELGEKENYALRLLRNNIDLHNEGVKLRGQRRALKRRVSRKRAEILKQKEEITNLKAENKFMKKQYFKLLQWVKRLETDATYEEIQAAAGCVILE